MNSKNKLVIIILVMIVTYCVFLNLKFKNISTISRIQSIGKENKSIKKIDYESVSPDGLNKVIVYTAAFDPSFYSDYNNDYYYNNRIISIVDTGTHEENYIFTGNRIGEPIWLGNEYIFFTSYCGTDCQGVYLVDVLNKETRLGILSGMDSQHNSKHYTIFKDWFGKEHKLSGYVDKIKSKIIKNQIYLIFNLSNSEDKNIIEKSFLFTNKLSE